MVTHLVALTEDAEKCRVAIDKNLKCRIVLPHWYALSFGIRCEGINVV